MERQVKAKCCYITRIKSAPSWLDKIHLPLLTWLWWTAKSCHNLISGKDYEVFLSLWSDVFLSSGFSYLPPFFFYTRLFTWNKNKKSWILALYWYFVTDLKIEEDQYLKLDIYFSCLDSLIFHIFSMKYAKWKMKINFCKDQYLFWFFLMLHNRTKIKITFKTLSSSSSHLSNSSFSSLTAIVKSIYFCWHWYSLA